MPDLFLPDLLCDPALLQGLGLDEGGGSATVLDGYAPTWSGSHALPGLRALTEASCPGQVFAVPELVWGPLSFAFAVGGCDLNVVPHQGGAIAAPMARDVADVDAARWIERRRPVWGEALPDILALSDRFSAAGVTARLPMILSRAHSRAMARTQTRPDFSGFSRSDVMVDAQNEPYTEYFAVAEYTLRHPTYDGGDSGPLRRAVFMTADAVTVLPYDPVRDRVLLVEQFRAAPFARGDRHPWLLEPVAGRIEPGDTPEETARKEAAEEAGLSLRALHHVGSYYPSTGCFSEYLVSYVGIADLPDSVEGLHGVEEEGEDIRAHVVSRTDLLARIVAGEMPDGPLLLSAFWLELNREKLLRG